MHKNNRSFSAAPCYRLCLAVLNGVALSVLLSFGSGCRTTVSGTKISQEQIAFIQPGGTTKREIIENLGPPTWEWEKQRGIAYKWEKGVAYETQGLSSGDGFAGFTCSAFCAAFDENDRLVKKTFLKEGSSDELKDAILKWLKAPVTAAEKSSKH